MVRLRNEDLFGKRLGELCVVFLRRIFALSEVKSGPGCRCQRDFFDEFAH